MTEEDVKKGIKTPAVLEAFELARLVSLPEAVRKNYDKEAARYINILSYIEEEKAKERAEGRAEGVMKEKEEIARELHLEGFDMQKISKVTKLPLDILKEILKVGSKR